MMYYTYDGSPLGLICAVAAALSVTSPRENPAREDLARKGLAREDLARKDLAREDLARKDGQGDASGDASVVPEARCQPGLFDETYRVEPNAVLAEDFLRTLAQCLPARVFQDLFYCFFTGEPGTEATVLAYVRMLLATDGRAVDDWANEIVRRARGLSKRIRYEIQRFHGIVRFRRLDDGTYYAQVEPDHAILPLLAPHFAARFADQAWFIHDLRRNTGIYHERGAGEEWIVLPEVEWTLETRQAGGRWEALTDACSRDSRDSRGPRGVDVEDGVFQDLWLTYFREIAIPERTNPRLQRQHVPQRYWRNMVELAEASEAAASRRSSTAVHAPSRLPERPGREGDGNRGVVRREATTIR